MSENTNVLDPSLILHSTGQVITSLKDPYDAIAAASHAIMLGVGFRFAGLGDDARQEGDGTTKKLPEGWNTNGPHSYHFRYSHPQSSLTFVIKVVRLGEKCIILGLGIGDDKTATLEIKTQDYTSESFYPYHITDQDRPLVHGFISSSRFEDFIKAYKLNIIQKLIPGLNKPGYEDNSTTTTSQSNPSGTRGQQQQRFTDPHSSDDPLYPDVGGSDLNPMRGGGGLRMPGSGGSGMLVGPNHPIFGNTGGSSLEDPSGLFGGPQPLPRGSVPPGARFDPIGPFGSMPPRPPGRGGTSGGPRGPGGLYGGDPDNDELMPPGYADMFG